MADTPVQSVSGGPWTGTGNPPRERRDDTRKTGEGRGMGSGFGVRQTNQKLGGCDPVMGEAGYWPELEAMGWGVESPRRLEEARVGERYGLWPDMWAKRCSSQEPGVWE